jgi:TetR/AcrR family transcriptional repressor of nem operon
MKIENKDTKQQILDTGYRLMVSKGFSSVGLAEILASAGVPKGSFYYYFKSKEQFGKEVIHSYFSQYMIGLDEILSNSTGQAYDRLIDYWQRWVDTQSSECDERKCLVVKLSAEVADLSEPMRQVLLQGSMEVIERISLCIEEGGKDNSIVKLDPRSSAESLYTMWLGASLLSKLQQNSNALLHVMKTTKSVLKNNTVI